MDDSTRLRSGPLRSLFRDPGYMTPVVCAFGLALALGVAYLALAHPRGFGLSPDVLPPAAARTAWGPSRPGAVQPAEIQAARLAGLLSFLGALTVAAMATAGLTVLILSLGRAARRGRDMALRTALGATRGRLARLLAAEGVAVALVGGLLGLLGGLRAGRLLLASWPGPLAADAGAPPRSLLVAAALTALGAVLLTLLPLLAAPGEGRLRSVLSEGGRVSTARPERFLRNALVVSQLGASVALLTGAGLLVRRAFPVAPRSGPDSPGEVLTARLRPEGAAPDTLERVEFYRSLLRRAGELTTVEAESIASPGAAVGLGVRETVVAECGACVQGGLPKPLSSPEVREHSVSPGYFATVGQDLLQGRAFTDKDGPGAPLVAVVSRSLARAPFNFEGGDPLGRQIQIGGLAGPWLTIVGVVEDLSPPGLGSSRPPPPALYVSAYQFPPLEVDLALRRARGSGVVDLEPELRRAVTRAGVGAWAVDRVAPLDRVLQDYRAPLTWIGWLLMVAGGSALFLAVHGLYAVTAYHVRLRRREIGIRMALGSDPRGVLRLVLGENLRVLGTGGLLGVWAGLGLGGALRHLGLPVFDPMVTGAILVVLLSAGAAGSWRPAREAASVEPAVTLTEG